MTDVDTGQMQPQPGKLIVTRGVAGCGKTRWAKAWVAANPARRFRVGRDDLGLMGHGWRSHDPGPTEDQITLAQEGLVERLLRAGYWVVVDDTNLPQEVVDRFADLARRSGATFEVHDMRHVDEATCQRQNAMRPKDQRVPPEEISRMFAEHINHRVGSV